MKGINIKQRTYTVIVLIILISITGFASTINAQDQGLKQYLYSSYIPSYLTLSIFGNTSYPRLNGGGFYSASSVIPNSFNPSWTSSFVSNISSPYPISSKVPSFSGLPLITSYSASPSLLYTSLFGLGLTASSYQSSYAIPPLGVSTLYKSPSLYVSPYLPFSWSSLPFTTTYLRTGLWAWPVSPYVEKDLDQLWDKIREAIENGLPRTAIDHLKEFIPKALKKEEYGLAMKGICKQLVLEANIQGNKPEEKVTRLTEEIEKAPELLRPLLKLVLAQWYWQYYQANRWRFSERDPTAEIDDADFTTWDLPRLLNKIDGLYIEVLSQEEQLKSMSMEMFTDFFEEGSVPVSYRPTLYDFAAFSAIAFYQDGDQIRNEPEDAFELDADSDAFAQTVHFIQYLPETTDTSSPVLKAMKLYQRLLDFHINDPSKEAFVDADINRLIFVNAYSFGEEKSDHYMTRLSEIAEAYSSIPLSSLAYYYWAQELYGQYNYVEARTIAQKGETQHPDSYGGKMCRYLLARIEAKEMNLKSEYSITPSFAEVRIDYRNITQVHLRVVEDQWDEFLEEQYGYPDDIDEDKFQQLITRTPLKSWSVALEPTVDFMTHSHAIEMPSLQPGYYRLIASWRQDFAKEENAIRIVTFWVTEIAMVTKTINGISGGLILDAHTGAPMEGGKITIFQENSEGYYKETGVTYTDENGSFTSPRIPPVAVVRGEIFS